MAGYGAQHRGTLTISGAAVFALFRVRMNVIV